MQVFDRAHFDHMTAADRDLQLEVLGLFRTQADTWRTLTPATPGWRDAVHTLKGSARGIGLTVLAEACECVEKAADAEADAGLAAVCVALDEALMALDQFAAAAA